MYRIEWTQPVLRRLAQLFAEAAIYGQAGEMLAALGRVRLRLESAPHGAGEIKFHLRAGFPVHDVADAPLLVRFAVVDHIRQVWVIGVHRMSSRDE